MNFLRLVWFNFPYQCCHGHLRPKMDSYYWYHCLYLLYCCQRSTHSDSIVSLYVSDQQSVLIQEGQIAFLIAAASVGIVSAPFWASQANYISRIATYHARLKQKEVGHVVSLFFGIFFAVFGTCNIWGNLVSYFVLQQDNNPQKVNCGIHFNPNSENATAPPSNVSDTTVSEPLLSTVCFPTNSLFIAALCLVWDTYWNGCYFHTSPSRTRSNSLG